MDTLQQTATCYISHNDIQDSIKVNYLVKKNSRNSNAACQNK